MGSKDAAPESRLARPAMVCCASLAIAKQSNADAAHASLTMLQFAIHPTLTTTRMCNVTVCKPVPSFLSFFLYSFFILVAHFLWMNVPDKGWKNPASHSLSHHSEVH